MIAPHGRMVFYKTPQQATELDGFSGGGGFAWQVTPDFGLPENSGTLRVSIYSNVGVSLSVFYYGLW